MHLGGIHIIFGLGFLLLTILLTTIYAYCGYLLIASLQHFLYKFKKTMAMSKYIRGRGPNPDEVVENPALKYWNKKALFAILISVTIILSTVYIKQRIYWLGSGDAHHKAKEYFMAGQAVFAHRRIAELFLHPENPLLFPYTKLQLEKVCGRSIPEEKYVVASQSDKFSFCTDDYVEHVFRNELKIFIHGE
ncbi:MAG: hypothetical protein JRJ39_01175 [Deltaproteobacteria bacterium]|nr:hypothetical protein [Deltaproteobacteria bacterium]